MIIQRDLSKYYLVIIKCLLIVPLLSSCYILNQAGPYLSQRIEAVPLDKLETSNNAELENFVKNVDDIREFAQTELGLNQGKNFQKYYTIDRDYLAAVIQAAGEFSLTPWSFKYPIFGDLPYKGYYNKDDAIEEGKKLKEKGLDVFIRKVDAFSSLGYFADPLYSYMVNYDLYSLAELLIHEETHATIFF